MQRIPAKSERATEAYQLVCSLQLRFADKLNQISETFGANLKFVPVEWLRDAGNHGGGNRYVATDEKIFNRASINVSQVQYDDDDAKSLASASAISTIIHPKNPLAPSVHIHISWTELKSGKGYWRVMADLNPAIPIDEDKEKFASRLEQAEPALYADASSQGDKYFFIPALNRHRGVTHFYLENYFSGDFARDKDLARRIGEAAIDTYCEILAHALKSRTHPEQSDFDKQREYHTVYFFQVLTLDRGTTSGLLVHNQNDVGILGSLPSHINKALLASWKNKMPIPQDDLLQALLDCLPASDICEIDDEIKQALADAIRDHYIQHPEAIDMQASGNSVPTTVDNHR